MRRTSGWCERNCHCLMCPCCAFPPGLIWDIRPQNFPDVNVGPHVKSHLCRWSDSLLVPLLQMISLLSARWIFFWLIHISERFLRTCACGLGVLLELKETCSHAGSLLGTWNLRLCETQQEAQHFLFWGYHFQYECRSWNRWAAESEGFPFVLRFWQDLKCFMTHYASWTRRALFVPPGGSALWCVTSTSIVWPDCSFFF